jgi:hypothetical protein
MNAIVILPLLALWLVLSGAQGKPTTPPKTTSKQIQAQIKFPGFFRYPADGSTAPLWSAGACSRFAVWAACRPKAYTPTAASRLSESGGEPPHSKRREQKDPVKPPESKEQKEIKPTPGIRKDLPVRLGGVYTLGLGEGEKGLEDSAAKGTKLSADNQKWIAENCDVIALSANTIAPDTFPALYKAQRLITPLLYVYASTLYEQPDHKGNVGGWKPESRDWTLRSDKGEEIAHPDAGGHWMDFGNKDWAALWKTQALALVGKYAAQGVVAAELPVGNTFVGDNLARYKTSADRARATEDWLRAVRTKNRYLMIPSAIGFDALAGHATLPTEPGTEEPELAGRLWDEFASLMDGGWSEGWIRPYWADDSLPETYWELALEAADRASKTGQVFIAAAAYRNDDELEFALASYLLVAHRQGRLVFQPMPLGLSERPDAGFSLAVLRKEVAAKSRFFQVPLGVGYDERRRIAMQGGFVWRRFFVGGVVYVNSDDKQTVNVLLGGPMLRVDGTPVRQVEMAPHSGLILLYPRAGQ